MMSETLYFEFYNMRITVLKISCLFTFDREFFLQVSKWCSSDRWRAKQFSWGDVIRVGNE